MLLKSRADLFENENKEFVVMVNILKGLQIGIMTEVQMATTESIEWRVD